MKVTIEAATANDSVIVNNKQVYGSGSGSAAPPEGNTLLAQYPNAKELQDHAKEINFLARITIDGVQYHPGWNPDTRYKSTPTSIVYVDGAMTTSEPTSNAPPAIPQTAGVAEITWTNELESGQWKDADAPLYTKGAKLHFRTPTTSTHDRSLPGGGGQFSCGFGKFTAPKNINARVLANGKEVWKGTGNQVQVGFGMDKSGPNTPFTLPLNADITLEFLPTEPTIAGQGAPTWIAEVQLPGRGTAVYTWS